MLYHINNWCPKAGMSTSGFSIELFPLWKEKFKKSGITQEQANNAVKKLKKYWLECHGYDVDINEHCIRVAVGEWGLEHISVPGNACGLDISESSMGAPKNGKVLIPHNVDAIHQASLLLTIFLWFANCIVCEIKAEHFQINIQSQPKKQSNK